LRRAAKIKNAKASGTLNAKPVKLGGRLSLFRYPEDAIEVDEVKPKKNRKRGSFN